MSEKELYRQKMKAQVDELMADVEKIKARASAASVDIKLRLAEDVKHLEMKIDEGKAKLTELAEASEGRWESVKDSFESGWGAIRSAITDASKKFKD